MVMAPVAAALGLGVGLGVVWLLSGLRRSATPSAPFSVRNVREAPRHVASRRTRRFVAAVTIGIAVGLISRWPVAGLLGSIATAALPGRLQWRRTGRGSQRAEAVAAWTELLRDTLAASAGLAEAIVTSATSAPLEVSEEVRLLARRLTTGVPMENALRHFAAEVDNQAADYVVCALLMAATSRSQKLVEVLGALATSIRDDVTMRLRVDASRASARSSVKTIIVFSIGFVSLLMLFAHQYLLVFGTPMGQAVLALIGVLYAAGIALMLKLVRPEPAARLLDPGA